MKTTITNILASTPIQWVSRIILGGIFIWASIDKLAHPAAFADIIWNYKILPEAFIYITAVTMPWMEIVAGICVLAGFMKRAGAVILGGLLMLFICAISFNLARGLDFNCGCFSTTGQEGGSDPVSLLIRDILLMIAVTAVVFFSKQKEAGKINA